MHPTVASLFDLSGKTALITGGTSPLGHEAAAVLAAAGCAVVLTSREAQKAEAAARQLAQEYETDALGLPLDHTDPAAVAACADRVRAWKGRLDVLVNNAGGGSGTSVARLFERDPAHIHQSIQTNLTGTLYCCREFGKIMADQGRGKIINVASIAGLVGRDRRLYQRAGMLGQPVDYAAAKAGVIGLTRDLAGFLSPLGVHVNAISPGGITGPTRSHPEQFVREYSDKTPLGRMGRDGIDLRGAILFLASPASDYVTGHNLIVDGGFSLWH